MDILDGLLTVAHDMSPINYFKFVVLMWFNNEYVIVKINEVLLNNGNFNMVALWRTVKKFMLHMESDNPNVPLRQMELRFAESVFDEFIATLKVSFSSEQILSG